MVSLSRQLSKKIKEKDDIYLKSFFHFVTNKEIDNQFPTDSNNANDLAINGLKAIQNQQKEKFENIYNRISARNPSVNSDWLYNDILFFSLVLGCKEFNCNCTWLLETLEFGYKNTSGKKKKIFKAYIDFLNNNLQNKSTHLPLLTVLLDHRDYCFQDKYFLNRAYDQIKDESLVDSEPSFLKIIYSSAFDTIIKAKNIDDYLKIKSFETFHATFERRITQISYIIWSILVIGLIYISYLFINNDVLEDPYWGDIISYIGGGGLIFTTILGVSKVTSTIQFLFKKAFQFPINDS